MLMWMLTRHKIWSHLYMLMRILTVRHILRKSFIFLRIFVWHKSLRDLRYFVFVSQHQVPVQVFWLVKQLAIWRRRTYRTDTCDICMGSHMVKQLLSFHRLYLAKRTTVFFKIVFVVLINFYPINWNIFFNFLNTKCLTLNASFKMVF